MVDAVAQSLADVTILHFTSQLGAVDEAIAQTIDNDSGLRGKRDLLLSISGVGEILAGVVMRKLLVLCFGVLKTGKPFDPAIAMGC